MLGPSDFKHLSNPRTCACGWLNQLTVPAGRCAPASKTVVAKLAHGPYLADGLFWCGEREMGFFLFLLRWVFTVARGLQ